MLLTPRLQRFIREHEHDDPHQLALQASRYPNYPIPTVVAQIQARQRARHKLPEWYATEDIVFPPMLSVEQCSSQVTAQYKGHLVRGQRLVDLTGGAGVDTYYLSPSFASTDYVEQQAYLTAIAQHNFSALGANRIQTHHTSAAAFLETLTEPVDCIYLDPARRGAQAQRVFRLEDCQPNALELRDTLLAKAQTVLIKTAPLLDIQAAVRSLAHVTQVHVVAVRNEVKEVLYQLSPSAGTDPVITAVNLETATEAHFSFRRSQEAAAEVTYTEPLTYLYEPHASLMKAGAFRSVAQHFNLHKLHPHTHLYTADQLVPDFPGRIFRCQAVVPYRKKAVRSQLRTTQANVTTRNFPDSVAAVRRKLGLRDGGDAYLFAVRLMDEQLRIIIAQK